MEKIEEDERRVLVELAKLAASFAVIPFPLTPTSDLSDGKIQVVRGNLEGNLKDAISCAAIVFFLSEQSAQRLHFNRILSSERILKLIDVGPNEPLSPELEAEAMRSAAVKLQNFISTSPDFQKTLLRTIVEFGEVPDFRRSQENLLRQATILVWNAFEVFARDLVECLLNQNPKFWKKVNEISGIDLGRLDLESLELFDFDLSKTMGSYFVSKQDFSDFSTITKLLGKLLNSSVSSLISGSQIYALSQYRNLFVHRRGKIDQKFASRMPGDFCVGEDLFVEPRLFRRFCEDVWQVGCAAAIAACDARCRSDSP